MTVLIIYLSWMKCEPNPPTLPSVLLPTEAGCTALIPCLGRQRRQRTFTSKMTTMTMHQRIFTDPPFVVLLNPVWCSWVYLSPGVEKRRSRCTKLPVRLNLHLNNLTRCENRARYLQIVLSDQY